MINIRRAIELINSGEVQMPSGVYNDLVFVNVGLSFHLYYDNMLVCDGTQKTYPCSGLLWMDSLCRLVEFLQVEAAYKGEPYCKHFGRIFWVQSQGSLEVYVTMLEGSCEHMVLVYKRGEWLHDGPWVADFTKAITEHHHQVFTLPKEQEVLDAYRAS